MNIIRMAIIALCLFGVLQAVTADQNLNYSFLYYENGFPTPYSHRRPQSEANQAARANPDLVFQTGYYSLMLDCDDLQLKGYNALAGSDYLAALDEDVNVFTPALSFTLRVTQDGIDYTCDGGVVQNPGPDKVNYVRLIESGQYVKRIDHLGLVFKDSGGNTLVVDDECRLEITAWPDRVTFFLDFSSETSNPVEQTMVQVVSPDGVSHTETAAGSRVRLTLKPQDDLKLSSMNPNDFVVEATRVQNGAALSVSFDEDVHALHIDVPADGVKYPSGINRVDEYLFEVTNSSAVAENIPLVFEQPSVRAITGTAMLLCDSETDRPLGIPVQISKNWHRDSNNPTVHEGSWMRGSTMLTLQPGESRRFKLRVVYGYWGGAGTVSHAQLSLIGWGKNWKWDESALGAWGESLTYDPCLHAGAAFLDDIRPAFTSAMGNWTPYADNSNTNTHNWTENTGGGDFLIYRDSANTYRWIKRLKTCYLQTGPNMTDVYYGGVTDDDKIRVTYVSRMGSTLDYQRHFHNYKYEFLQDVVSPQRLVFHQMAADYYSAARFDHYYVGDETGVLLTDTADLTGGNVYKGSPFRMDGRWLSVDDTFGNNGNNAALALRGMIPLSSTLNGSPFPLYAHKYGRTWGASTMLFDFSSDSVNRSYSAGDVVEGEIEFIMPPQHVTNYWGGDAELMNRLAAYGDAAWEPVRDEFVQNVQMDVAMRQGSLLRNYPLEIQPYSVGGVMADFLVQGGGLGHVPVTLKNAAADLDLKVQRWSGGAWTDLEGVDLAKRTYYQALLNPDGGMDYTFSIPRPTVNLNEDWRVRVLGGYSRFAEMEVLPTEGLLVSQLENTHPAGFQYNGTVGGQDAGLGQSFSFETEQSLRAITVHKSGNIAIPDGSHLVNLWIGEYDSITDPLNHAVGATLYEDIIDVSAQTFTNDYFYTFNLASNLNLSAGEEYAFQLVFDALDASHVFNIHRYYPGAHDAYPDGTIVYQQNVNGAVPFQSLIDEPDNEMAFALHASVVGDPSALDVWADGFGLRGTNARSSSNPDGDTANNLYEYALGGDPTNETDIGHIPTFGTRLAGGSNCVEYTYARRIGSDGELDYYLNLTTDLVDGSWTNNGYAELPMTGIIDAYFEAVTNRIDTSENTNAFIRLMVDEL